MGKLEHEYSVVGGFNRAKIGHWIGGLAVLISSGVVTIVLALIEIAKRHGFGSDIPQIILWPLGAGTIYLSLYWIFESKAWRNRHLSYMLKVPDLEGTWNCTGRKLTPEGHIELEWRGVVTIVQSWDFIRIYLKTADSESDSISAALLYDKAAGYKLMYTYRNRPNPARPDLASHTGYAELMFNGAVSEADGDYFNGRGRYSYGTMRLEKA